MKNTFLELLKDIHMNQKSNPCLISNELYKLSKEHQVTSLIFNQIYSFDFDPTLKQHWKKETIYSVSLQTMKTEAFLTIYKKLREKNINVLVVKGLILRNLYPNPDYRSSNDEDLYVQLNEYEISKQVFIENGYKIIQESDIETTFIHPNGVRIELHTSLFSKDNKAYGNYQEYFKDAFKDVCVHNIHDVEVLSLNHQKHYLFLILHFVKHFLHGGVGIRQILDMVIYAENFGMYINWEQIYSILNKNHLLYLYENVIAISQDYLGFNTINIPLPKDYQKKNYDYQALLDDILDAGVFGQSTVERKHTATMTLNALKNGKTNLLKSIFPSMSEMKSKFKYLNKYPYLLIYAWCVRIIHYIFDKNQGNSKKTIELGQERIELLRKYKIIKN